MKRGEKKERQRRQREVEVERITVADYILNFGKKRKKKKLRYRRLLRWQCHVFQFSESHSAAASSETQLLYPVTFPRFSSAHG
jgi:hypothetical protein